MFHRVLYDAPSVPRKCAPARVCRPKLGIFILPLTLSLPLAFQEAALLAQEGAVNGHLKLDMSRFEPYEVEVEQQLSDTLKAIMTTRYFRSAPAGTEDTITRVFDWELFDWSAGYPKKVRHYTLRTAALARGLEPVRTEVVDQVWDDVAAAWNTTRSHLIYERGSVQSFQSAGDTARLELPAGILQGDMLSLAFGLQADLDPPAELVITYHDRATNSIAEGQYTIQGRTSQRAAGHSFEALRVQMTRSTNPDAASYALYAAEVPRFYLGSFNENPPTIVTRLRRDAREEAP